MTQTTWIKGLVPLALFMGLAVFLASSLTRDPSLLPSELIDRPIPEFELVNPSGDTVTQADLIGEVSLMNIFGSWCVACLQEHELLMDIGANASVPLIGVNWRDDPQKAKAWLHRYGNPYDRIIVDPQSRLVMALGVTGAPESFVIDRRGRIRYKHVGPISEKDWSQTLRPLIDSLRTEPDVKTASEAAPASL